MRATLTTMQVLSLLIALPVLAENVGLHNSSAQPTRAEALTLNDLKTLDYGVCEFVAKNELGADVDVKKEDISRYSLRPQYLADEFLPEDLKSKFEGGMLNADELTLVSNWIDNITVKRSREPANGTMLDTTHYLPNKGYVGKDRIDFLLEGKDSKGQPFSINVKYYLNVMSDPQLADIIKNDKSYQQAVRKYCGTNSSLWKIAYDQTVVIEKTGTLGQRPLPSPRRLG